MRPIVTERLEIRFLSEADEALYCELFTDAQTMRYIGPPLAPQAAIRSFRKAVALTQERPPARVFMSGLSRKDGRKIGMGSIQWGSPGSPRAEVGLMILPDFRSQGYGKELLRAVLAQAFALFPIEEAQVRFSAEDPAVRRINMAVGLHPATRPAPYEGHSPADLGSDPGRTAKLLWSIDRAAWNARVTRSDASAPTGD